MVTRHQNMQCWHHQSPNYLSGDIWHHQSPNYLSGDISKYTIEVPEVAFEFCILKLLMENYPNQTWNQ